MITKTVTLNFIFKLFTSIIPSILGLIINNLIIDKYGSDINGIFATISQLTMLFLIFEGGISVATISSSYKIYENKLYNDFNILLSYTNYIYIRIGKFLFLIAFPLIFFLPFFFQSNTDINTIRFLVSIIFVSLFATFFITAKYRIILNVLQKDYIRIFSLLLLTIISQLISIFLIYNMANIILIKFILVIIPIFHIVIIKIYLSKNFNFINYKIKIDKNKRYINFFPVFAQKFASIIFSSTDIILISILISVTQSSVYYLYALIYGFIKNIVFSVLLAPITSFGKLNAQNKSIKLRKYYLSYIHLTMLIGTIFIISVSSVIVPFIKLYIPDNVNFNYINYNLVTLFSIVVFLELTSSFLGAFSNAIGQFQQMKKISYLGVIINIVLSLILILQFGVEGLLIGTTLGYIVMVTFQLFLVFKNYFKIRFIKVSIFLVFNFLIVIVTSIFFTNFNFTFHNYFQFLYYGFLVFIISTIFIWIINLIFLFIFNKEIIFHIWIIFSGLVKKIFQIKEKSNT